MMDSIAADHRHQIITRILSSIGYRLIRRRGCWWIVQAGEDTDKKPVRLGYTLT